MTRVQRTHIGNVVEMSGGFSGGVVKVFSHKLIAQSMSDSRPTAVIAIPSYNCGQALNQGSACACGCRELLVREVQRRVAGEFKIDIFRFNSSGYGCVS